ncbi:hypothetical protein OH76DRAFT_360952 [Lentinus brumalis]|uniref:Uncharacterized protein n=1 Tax=Lentinus brumalis TaxID=2498619 RepID=A0A371CJ51_9APHY|nr:hypothetical protein OH76DRAFT_360952 [Polyporus brumalis]
MSLPLHLYVLHVQGVQFVRVSTVKSIAPTSCERSRLPASRARRCALCVLRLMFLSFLPLPVHIQPERTNITHLRAHRSPVASSSRRVSSVYSVTVCRFECSDVSISRPLPTLSRNFADDLRRLLHSDRHARGVQVSYPNSRFALRVHARHLRIITCDRRALLPTHWPTVQTLATAPSVPGGSTPRAHPCFMFAVLGELVRAGCGQCMNFQVIAVSPWDRRHVRPRAEQSERRTRLRGGAPLNDQDSVRRTETSSLTQGVTSKLQ